MQTEKIIQKIKSVLSAREEIVFAYLFGSVAKEKAGPISDIDIAVYLEEETDLTSGSFGYKAELIFDLQRGLNTNQIDLVILNQAPLFLAFNVLKEGKLIFCRSKEIRVDYHYLIQRDYLDFKPAVKVQDYYLQQELDSLGEER